MSIIPEKYHNFISPPLRRVFLDARGDNTRGVMIDSLNAETAALKERVTSLNRDKDLFQDRYDSAQGELVRLRADERAARFASSKVKADALKDKENLNRLKAQVFFILFFVSCMNAWCDTCQLSGWWWCAWKSLANGVEKAFHALQLMSTKQQPMYNNVIYL